MADDVTNWSFLSVLLKSSCTIFKCDEGSFFTLFHLFILYSSIMSRDSSVGIATGYGLDEKGGGSSSPGRVKNFHFSISSRPALGSTQPPTKWVPGALSPGVKQQGREAEQSPPASAKVKKMWIYTSTPPCVFMA
jgi:hypothetical protein